MSLRTPLEISQVWGSHVPLLKAVLACLNIRTAVECGCGEYSTPLLARGAHRLWTIEHDVAWAKKMQEREAPNPGHEWILRKMPFKNGTRRFEATLAQLKEAEDFYSLDVGKCLPTSFDLLFNDTYTSCRLPAWKYLASKARYVILHDTEPPSPVWYDHLLFDFSGWLRWRLAPIGLRVNGHQVAWTDLFLREGGPSPEMQQIVRQESKALWGSEYELREVTT